MYSEYTVLLHPDDLDDVPSHLRDREDQIRYRLAGRGRFDVGARALACA